MTWSQKGWLTVALSQPGYGKSDGPSDFCGPRTQNAARAVIDHVRKMEFIKKKSIVVYEELSSRSPINFADNVKANILMFHGENDERAPFEHAKQFAEKVRAHGGKVTLIPFPAEHIIPPQLIAEPMEEFLRKMESISRQ